MAWIKLSKGKYTLVDDEDFEYLNQWKWKYHKDGYAVRTITGGGQLYMHRVINKTPDDLMTDHIDRNTLNNKKHNLRIATNGQNLMNTGLWRHNTSGYKGVYWSKQKNKWHARVMVNQKHIHLGFYSSLQNAALARENWELRYAM